MAGHLASRIGVSEAVLNTQSIVSQPVQPDTGTILTCSFLEALKCP